MHSKNAEDRMRYWAFRIYYERCYATVQDPGLRFCLALVASTKPIKNRAAMAAWASGEFKAMQHVCGEEERV